MARKPFTDEERRAYMEAKQKQRDELEARVHDLVDSFRDSDTFKSYLSQMNEFNRNCVKYLHRYSPNNLLYIIMQDPTASIVGSASAWRKMGRFVNKGEHSRIQVWAPIKEAVMRNKVDENGESVLKADGTPEREPVRDENGRTMYRFSGRFTLKPVFDVSQTDGEPLPELARELKSPVEHYTDYEKAIRAASPLPIFFSDEPQAAKLPLGGAKGVCSFTDGMIVVKAGMSEQHTLKTMVHEATHAKFHSPAKLKAAIGEDGEGFSRNDIEVQAECTAFLVCDHFGMDTSDYSIPYIMSWGEDEKLTPLTKSLDAILTASNEVIDQMETHLWVDMGIDEALEDAKAPDRSSSPLVPAVYDPSMAVDLDRLLANKTVAALQGMGFRIRYEKPLVQGGAPAVALQRDTKDGRVRIEARLFSDKDGYLVPDFDSHGTTRLSAFRKGEDEPFFADGGGNLVDQFRELEKRLEREPRSVDEPAAEAGAPAAEGAGQSDPYAGCLLADPRAQTLMRAGYVVREGEVATPNGNVNGLIFSNGNGTYRLQVEMVPEFAPLEGSPAVSVFHPHTTALTGYDLTGGEPVKFFEARFDGTIQEQMASLRSNERYRDLRATACGERKAPEQDPVAYMKRKREARRSQMPGPGNRASLSLAEQAKPRRELSR